MAFFKFLLLSNEFLEEKGSEFFILTVLQLIILVLNLFFIKFFISYIC